MKKELFARRTGLFRPIVKQLQHILRAALCALLTVGYGAMYAGSILHDLGHEFGGTEEMHACDHEAAITEHHDGEHVDVTCFFCSHSQVASADLVVEQTWTPAIGALAPPLTAVCTVLSSSFELPSLRGPPTA